MKKCLKRRESGWGAFSVGEDKGIECGDAPGVRLGKARTEMAEQLEVLKRAHDTLVVERDRLAKDLEETFHEKSTEQLIVVLQAIGDATRLVARLGPSACRRIPLHGLIVVRCH